MAQWLLAQSKRSEPQEQAYFRAFGSEATSLDVLVRVAGMRWASEESFADANGSVGPDQERYTSGRPGIATSRSRSWPTPIWK